MAAETDPLQAALQTAFEESPVPPTASVSLPSSQDAELPTTSLVVESTTETAPSQDDDEWKQEYERLQTTWRMESAAARQKAESNRERWSKIREEEGEQELKEIDVKPPALEPSATLVQLSSTSSTPISADATVTADAGTAEALSGSRTWEEVPSLASSFPSFSLHESSSGSNELPELPPYLPPPKPPSVTFAIFDNSLSRRARVLAFASSFAINLLLPFINGVMLGFGEIFAKNIVVGYFGWDIPGPGVGIRTRVRNRNHV